MADDKKLVNLTPAQQKYVAVLQKRVLDFQQMAQTELNRLNGALQEALNYIREENGIPLGEPYTLSEDAGQLVYTPQPPATVQ